VAGSCEHGHEPTRSIKDGECFDLAECEKLGFPVGSLLLGFCSKAYCQLTLYQKQKSNIMHDLTEPCQVRIHCVRPVPNL
jgi:hypothetical protein